MRRAEFERQLPFLKDAEQRALIEWEISRDEEHRAYKRWDAARCAIEYPQLDEEEKSA